MAELRCKVTGGILTATDEQAERMCAGGSFERVSEKPTRKAPARKTKEQ